MADRVLWTGEHLRLEIGRQILFNDASFSINDGERVALVGRNGCGKSTLMKIIAGLDTLSAGEITMAKNIRIAYMPQDFTLDPDATVRSVAAEGVQYFTGMLKRYQELPASSPEHERLEHLLTYHNAWDTTNKIETILAKLNLNDAEKKCSLLSGGERRRVMLARSIIAEPDLLLLDEPTNHLDLDAILWLEDWLKRYSGTLIVISHDRDFLDGIANVILHIDDGKLKRYAGNYSAFERQRAEQMTLMQSMIEKQAKRRAHLQSYISRFQYKATKARQAQSRIKALEKMEELAPLRAAAEFSFEFFEPESSPNPLLVMNGLTAGYTDRDANGDIVSTTPIVKDIQFALQTGERIGLLGVNGAGKSTFIKTVAAGLEPLSGKFTTGKGLKIGYFAQHQVEMLRNEESPLWHLMKIAPDTREQELRNFLGSFNFHGEMATSPVAPFSGGEKARLALALIVWERPNLLLLDEPTNHLDLDMREALTEALAQYEGTLLLVSHDRHLLRATTDRFYIVSEGKLKEFDGDLDDYRDWLFKIHLEKNSVHHNDAPADLQARQAIDRKEQKRLEAEERQRLSALKKPLEKRLNWLENEIGKLNDKKSAIDSQLTDPAIYEQANKDKLKKLLADQVECTKVLGALEEEWLEKQDELENLLSS